jgi:hypothetical protein
VIPPTANVLLEFPAGGFAVACCVSTAKANAKSGVAASSANFVLLSNIFVSSDFLSVLIRFSPRSLKIQMPCSFFLQAIRMTYLARMGQT